MYNKRGKPIFVIVPLLVAILTMIGATPTHVAFADPAHCDQPGWPTCYSVGNSDGQGNSGPCPSGHTSEYCRGWNDATGGNSGGSTSSSSSSSSSTSAGTQHHTAAYETGYLYGAEDRGGEYHALDQCQASDYTGKDLEHCIAGYNDGFNGVIQSGQGPS
jgi:hypothetical protein